MIKNKNKKKIFKKRTKVFKFQSSEKMGRSTEILHFEVMIECPSLVDLLKKNIHRKGWFFFSIVNIKGLPSKFEPV